MNSKPCTKCEVPQVLTEFYPRKSTKDGLAYWCKSCARDYRKENIVSINESASVYRTENREEINSRGRKYRSENPDKTAECLQKHRSKNRDSINKKAKLYQADNPNKMKARQLLSTAIKAGSIIRGLCSCGSTKPTDGHHEDYSKPLEVEWLCRPCHRQWHIAHGPGLNG